MHTSSPSSWLETMPSDPMKPQRNDGAVATAAEPTPATLVSIKCLGKKKSLAISVTLKLMSQRAFSQGKELLNISSFPTQFRVREHETALRSTPSEGRGQGVKNVFNLLMFLTYVLQLHCLTTQRISTKPEKLRVTASLSPRQCLHLPRPREQALQYRLPPSSSLDKYPILLSTDRTTLIVSNHLQRDKAAAPRKSESHLLSVC